MQPLPALPQSGAAPVAPACRAPQEECGRFAFHGSGFELLWIEASNFVLSIVTLGIASLLALPQWRLSHFWVENTTLDGEALSYDVTWGDELGHQILTSLLVLVTCGLALPWAIAKAHRFRWTRAKTRDGRRVTMEGGLFEDGVVVGALILLVVLTFGLAVPVAYAWWRSYWMRRMCVEDPRVPGGWYRLRFDAGYISLLVQWALNHMLIGVTFYLYLPWAIVNLSKFAWSATGDDQSPLLKVPAGPRTPAQWAIVVLQAVTVLLISLGMLSLVAAAIWYNVTDSEKTEGSGSAPQPVVAHSPAKPRTPGKTRAAPASVKPTHCVHNTASDVNAPWLALRSGPNRRSELLARMPDGTKVRRIRSTGAWHYVQVAGGLDKGKLGYAHSRYLEPVSLSPTATGATKGFSEPIPEGRSKPPTVREWNQAVKVDLRPDGCFRKVVREWLKLNCSKDDDNSLYPIGIGRIRGMGGEGSGHFAWSKEGRVIDVVVAMRRGARGTASFRLRSRAIVAGYDWRNGGDYPEIIWQ